MKKNITTCRFVIRTNKSNSKGLSPIYVRLRLNGSTTEISTNCYVDKNKWDGNNQTLKRNSLNWETIKRTLNRIEEYLHSIIRENSVKGIILTPKEVKDAYLNRNNNIDPTFSDCCSEYCQLKEQSCCKSTMNRLNKINRYINEFNGLLKRKNIRLSEIGYEFLQGYHNWMRNTKCNQNSTIHKDIGTIKGILKHADRCGKVIDKGALNFKMHVEDKNRDSLNTEDLAKLISFETENESLQKVRDLFLFQCQTGVSFIDLINLKTTNIVTRIEGKFISCKRSKSKVEFSIPLSEITTKIIEQYAKHPRRLDGDFLFPSYSNAAYNRMLKKLGSELCLTKVLTSHLGRHTFASLCVQSDCSVTDIMRMMGHKKITTTQIYANTSMISISATYKKFLEGLGGSAASNS